LNGYRGFFGFGACCTKKSGVALLLLLQLGATALVMLQQPKCNGLYKVNFYGQIRHGGYLLTKDFGWAVSMFSDGHTP
jgi:hypothetical protein